MVSSIPFINIIVWFQGENCSRKLMAPIFGGQLIDNRIQKMWGHGQTTEFNFFRNLTIFLFWKNQSLKIPNLIFKNTQNRWTYHAINSVNNHSTKAYKYRWPNKSGWNINYKGLLIYHQSMYKWNMPTSSNILNQRKLGSTTNLTSLGK